MVAFSRAMTRWASKGRLDEGGGVVLSAGGTWIPMIANTASRLDDSVRPEVLLERADAFFGAIGRGFTVPVRETKGDNDLRSACEKAGLELFGTSIPDMVCTARLADLPPAPGIVLRDLRDEADVRAFTDVNTAAYGTYGMPAEVFADLFDLPAILVDDPATHVMLATRDDVAVATALLYESDGAGSVQWVGTVPDARGSGLGALVTVAVTNLAFDRGASSVSLQASPMGAPVYLRLGYETVYTHVEYVRMPKRPA